MKDTDFKGKSSPRSFGKGLMIAVVVVFSSLSFVLGYFVGKVGREEPTGPLVNASETAVQPGTPGIQPAQPVTPETPAESSTVSSDYRPLPANPADRPHQASGPDLNLPAQQKKFEKDLPLPSPSGAKEQTARPPAAKKKEASGDETSLKHGAGQASGEVYTVQLGALKRAADAKKLRTKFEKKGYKTSIVAAKNKKHERIYKVRVGEFNRKRDAEIFALKLRKTEGLKAFVTVRN
jgi:cell division septation protein DedD